MIKRGFIIAFIFLFLLSYTSAAKNQCVSAEVTDINPSSIGVNEEFTIGVQIESCGSDIPEYITYELITPPTDILIQEPLIINISKLYYGNSERFIIYHMRTTEDAQIGTHLIKTRLSYGDTPDAIIKNYNITFEVIGDKADLSIASLKTDPATPRKKDTVELTLRIENTGDGTANAVEVLLDHDFKGLKQSFIGSLDADEDGPAVFTFIANKKGEFEIPVTIFYEDDYGKSEIPTNININILRKKSNIGTIIAALFILTIFGGGIHYFVKTKKAKDKVIQQLLTKNSNNNKSNNGIANKKSQKEKSKENNKNDKNKESENKNKPDKKVKKF